MGKNKKKKNINQEEALLNDVLGARNVPRELDADEVAVSAGALTLTDSSDLEQYVQDSIAENWDLGDEAATDEPTQAYTEEPYEGDAAYNEEYDYAQDPAYAEEAPQEKPAKKPRKKGRLKEFNRRFHSTHHRPYGLLGIPHIIATAIWLAVILGIGLTLGHLGWNCAADVLALGKVPAENSVIVTEDDDITSIADKLKEVGMIRYPQLFKLFCDLTGKGENTLVGTIIFKGDIVYDYNALVNALSYRGGSLVTVSVTVPEGYSCAQIFKLLDEKGVCSVEDLEDYAENGDLEDYWFLEDVQRNNRYCLEGFMFPDTYEFYMDDTAENVLNKFLADFDYRFTDRMKDKYEALQISTGLELSIRDVVTMASIIEKEKANDLEGYNISSVFYNRLRNSASFPFLNSDATILYDIDYYTGRALSAEEKENSPYNTYTRKGLPQGPISNPGLTSLDAALAPESTDYFYFVYDKEAGEHRFSKTLEEHEKLVRELGLG